MIRRTILVRNGVEVSLDSVDPTIRDFGEQWTRYRTFPGYMGSQELFRDMIEPLLSLADIEGSRVCEIGAGQGRIITMLMEAGASYAIAIEPSDAFKVLRDNVRQFGAKVECKHITGDRIPLGLDLDYILSLGVLTMCAIRCQSCGRRERRCVPADGCSYGFTAARGMRCICALPCRCGP